MSAPLLRRTLLLTVLLTLTLAACQNQSVAGPDTGDTGLEVGEQALVGQPASIHCTSEQLEAVAPCQGEGAGSVCTPENNTVVEWNPESQVVQYVHAPELTWTYPCSPDGYDVELLGEGGGAFQHSSTDNTYNPPEADGPAWSWLPGMSLWDSGHRYAYTVRAWLQGDTEWSTDRVWSEKGVIVFYTGPFCVDLSAPPQLVWPSDGAGFREAEQSQEGFSPEALGWAGEDCPDPNQPGFNRPELPGVPIDCHSYVLRSGFTWEYPSNWCLTRSERQVSTDSTFATGVMPILTSSPMDVTYGAVGGTVEWCHTYYWRVRAYAGAVRGPWSEVFSFRIAPPGGWEECYTFGRAIEAVATQNARCRVGPSTAYGVATYVAAGERHPVEGRNADGTWFKIQDLGCYISGGLLTFEQQSTPFPGGADVSDLMSSLPILPDPPLPTQPPEEEPVCSSTLSQTECAAAGGTWHGGGVRPPWCQCP